MNIKLYYMFTLISTCFLRPILLLKSFPLTESENAHSSLHFMFVHLHFKSYNGEYLEVTLGIRIRRDDL